jgi:phosphatidate cytidylyltransferase
MGVFSYMYFQSFIDIDQMTVGSVMETIIYHMSANDQLDLYIKLQNFLTSKGIMNT